jgi:hypothetical protein
MAITSAAAVRIRARQEMAQAKKTGSALDLCQAAEKHWLSVVRATDEALARNGIEILNNKDAHNFRKQVLQANGEQGVNMAKQYLAFENGLHGSCFYFEQCPENLVKDLIKDAGQYVERSRSIKLEPKGIVQRN